MKPIKLPLPYEGIDSVDSINPSTAGLASARKEAQAGNFWKGTYEILKDTVRVNGELLGKTILSTSWRNCEVLLLKIFVGLGIIKNYTGTSVCTECRHENKHSKMEIEDTRIDLSKVPVAYSDNPDPTFKIEPYPDKIAKQLIQQTKDDSEEDVKEKQKCILYLRRGDHVLIITSATFHHPTLQDMIDTARISKNYEDFEVNLYLKMMDDADFFWSGTDGEVESIDDVKIKFKNEKGGLLNNFTCIQYYDEIGAKISEFGLKPVELVCERCKSEYEFTPPYIDFFVSALRPNLPGSKKGIF